MKCGDCKWLTEDKRSSVGHECLQPDKKKAWDEKERQNEKAGKFLPEVVARYKPPSTKACKKFEAKGGVSNGCSNLYPRKSEDVPCL